MAPYGPRFWKDAGIAADTLMGVAEDCISKAGPTNAEMRDLIVAIFPDKKGLQELIVLLREHEEALR